MAIKVADELGMPHAYVVACIELEREKSEPVRRVWKAIAETFAGKAAAVILSCLLLAGLVPNQAHAGTAVTRVAGSVYTLCEVRRRLRRWLTARWPSHRTARRSIPALSLA